MNFEIFGEDKNIKLKLKKNADGEIILCIVDEKGDTIVGGNLITLHKDGSYSKHNFVNANLGFKLSQSGQILPNGKYFASSNQVFLASGCLF